MENIFLDQERKKLISVEGNLSLPDMLQVWEDVNVPSGDDLLEHGVNDNVASSPPHPGTATVISIQCDIITPGRQ